MQAPVNSVDEMVRYVQAPVNTCSELARLKRLIEDSKKPLYPGSAKYSRLSGDLKVLQLKAGRGWTDKRFKQLLGLAKRHATIGEPSGRVFLRGQEDNLSFGFRG